MQCQNCNNTMDDLTRGLGELRNHICRRCGSHHWKDKFYTRFEWEQYVELDDKEVFGHFDKVAWTTTKVRADHAFCRKDIEDMRNIILGDEYESKETT
jgi:hypothetical protein